ncbi:hypothetical protein lerEdw1_012700, partial [Lerista edwardsae]
HRDCHLQWVLSPVKRVQQFPSPQCVWLPKGSPKFGCTLRMMETNKLSEEGPPFTLRRFHISDDFGFLLPNPLKELPPFYGSWTEIVSQLSYLIENHQLRSRVDKLPLLSTQHLRGHRELSLAHMVLSFITMGYIWQEGETGTVKVLPQNIAVPFEELSRALGLPPILVHMDFVLVNWKKKDPSGNLEPIVCSPGGESTRAFILVTFLVEKAAAPGIKAVAQAVSSILQPNNRLLEEALQGLAKSLKDMMAMMKKMHEYVNPDIFYAVTRLFFSGTVLLASSPVADKMDNGRDTAQAAMLNVKRKAKDRSSMFHSIAPFFLCPLLAAFLHGMREYMPPRHQAFIKEIQAAPPLRKHILSSGSKDLCGAYNQCVAALVDLRTYHVAIVTKFITIAGINARAENGKLPHSMSPASFLEGRGTGGSPSGALNFLKSVRDTTKQALLCF